MLNYLRRDAQGRGGVCECLFVARLAATPRLPPLVHQLTIAAALLVHIRQYIDSANNLEPGKHCLFFCVLEGVFVMMRGRAAVTAAAASRSSREPFEASGTHLALFFCVC